MKKILLALCLLGAMPALTAFSTRTHSATTERTKLPPKAQALYEQVLGVYLVLAYKETITKDRNMYRIEIEGEASREEGFFPVTGYVIVNANGTYHTEDFNISF